MKRLREFIDTCTVAVVIIVAAWVLSGCTTKPQVEYRYIDLPAIPVVERPALETQKLVPGDAPATVVQAHREDIINLMSWGKQLEAILDGFRKLPQPSAPTVRDAK